MRKSRALVIASCIATSAAFAQHSAPDTLRAMRLAPDEHVTFDGVPDEAFWQRAIPVRNFTQHDPHVDEPAVDSTVVRVVYDDQALYFSAMLGVKDIEHMQAKFMERDFAWYKDDNFQFILSPFNDKRTGYIFVTNANGARTDMLIANGDRNIDWNGVWDVHAQCTPFGWTCEFRIPFSTLQFRKGEEQTWGINFERNVRVRNEQDNWQGWGRNTSIENLATAGTLTGLHNIGYSKRFEFKPYALGGIQDRPAPSSTVGKFGGDLNINLSPTLKLNLTANTDFAQVEADRIPVNLSRFNLFYPEKREFFLEGNGNFDFYLGNNNNVFYSRTIGIEQLQSVPVLGGARLFGKVGHHNIGALDIETGEADANGTHVPNTNNAVLRYKYDVGGQSSIGGIFTSHINRDETSQVIGIDGGYRTSAFLKNKQLDTHVCFAQSLTNGKSDHDGYAYRVYADYPNDLIDHFIAISGVHSGFQPALGFLQRSNYDALNWNLDITPRWFQKYGVRKILFEPFQIELYREAGTGRVESFNNNFRPFGFLAKTGDNLQLNFQQHYDHVKTPFAIGAIMVDSGAYWFNVTDLYFETFRGRRISFQTDPLWGSFYGGRILRLNGTLNMNINRHFNVSISHTWNQLIFHRGEQDEQRLETNEFALFPSYAFSTRLTLSVFCQWNSLNDLVRVNARLHWIPKIGSDLYLVFDQGHAPSRSIDLSDPVSRSLVGKLVWRVVF